MQDFYLFQCLSNHLPARLLLSRHWKSECRQASQRSEFPRIVTETVAQRNQFPRIITETVTYGPRTLAMTMNEGMKQLDLLTELLALFDSFERYYAS